VIRGLVLGAFLGGIIACAGQRAATAPAPTAGAEPPHAPVMGDDPHAQITALEHDIVANHGTFVDRDAMTSAVEPMSVLPKSTDASCHPAPTQTCGDSCKLSDSICDDAKKICDIASTLADDRWAAGKCESGKTSCTDAHKSCCECR
jgi:hypothetical protein